ncbi:MAG: hypothetical protein ACRC3B_15020 [Bacteroidia bacterium]
MNTAVFPIIIIERQKSLEIISENASFSRAAASALIRRDFFSNDLVFDSKGVLWSYNKRSDRFKHTFFTRLLAVSFYNPILDVKVYWE